MERAFESYDAHFARLALFVFHLACSGSWRRSKWPDGRVAGWANDFIREIAWHQGQWRSSAFSKGSLEAFIEERIEGEKVTKRKVLTNYRYMLLSAGISESQQLKPDHRDISWWITATHLFWDRQVFVGELHRSSTPKEFEETFYLHEVYKLLGCSKEQGRAIILSALRDYSGRLQQCVEQLEGLRSSIAA